MKGWISAATLAIALLTALLLSAPDPQRHGLVRVAASEIEMFAPGEMRIPMQPAAVRNRVPLSRQHEWDPDAARQYHLVVRSAVEALFVPRLGADSRLWINGMPVSRSEPVRMEGFGTGRELMAAGLPTTTMKFTDNRIDIVTDGDHANAGLAGVYLGKLAAVTAAADAQQAQWNRLAIATFLATVIGMASGLVGQLFGQDRPAHGATLLASLAALILWGHGQPGTGHLASVPLPLAAAAGLAGSLLAVVTLPRRNTAMGSLLHGLALTSLGAAIASGVTLLAPGVLPPSTAFMATGGLLALPLLGGPLLLLCEAQAYFGQLAAAESAIVAQRAIISQQEAALEEQIKAKAIVEERQRFVRDMHDGVGGQLLSLLMRVRMGKIGLSDVEDEIERGITDLRLVADSLDNVGNDLEAALATFQTRARQQLDAAHMTLEWHQPDQLGAPGLDARHILSLYRLMQEAVTNAARHSGGTTVAVSLYRLEPGSLAIAITDNGKGLGKAPSGAGHGLANMAKRAEALGGSLSIGAGDGGSGTSVLITLPRLS
ncbi:MAG: sensor histidine kinase [Novosphingobium sp.]